MKKSKIVIIATISLVVVFLLIFILIKSSTDKNDNTLRDNLYYGGIDVSSMNLNTAEEKIIKACNENESLGLYIRYNNKQIVIPATTISFDSDISYFNFRYKLEDIKSLLAKEKRGNSFSRWWNKYINRQRKVIKPELEVNQDRIKSVILNEFPDITIMPVDAAFIFSDNQITISEERPGKIVDWENLFNYINSNLSSFNQDLIIVKTKTEYPEIYRQELTGFEERAQALTNKELYLTYADKKWDVSREDIAGWLSVNKKGNKIGLNFNTERIASFLEKTVAPDIDTAPQEPRFEIKDNKVSSWQLGKAGAKLDLLESSQLIIDLYASSQTDNTIELITEAVEPTNPNSLEIKEIIGTGSSNFSGSSSKRRHNIEVGAAAIHGLIVKPGEEFSLMAALGEINADSGYVTELVIKDNQTIPEYGGGLCQIGTTVFRTALATGLPITARRNHSYRVSYYEPAGTDATIYDPWPDLRFVNDYPNNILIQSRIDGNEIFFDFWGVTDGRSATTTYPVIYNITPPPPTKIIETDTLAPGEKKCTEKAHNGADAYFDYTVIYPENATTTPEKVERFSSHYVPWQEVCLVGKEATSTPEIITETATPITDIIPATQP
ncbi:MAG: VanW family protein [Patescibacteria group bacterium]|nr:VanW family protein [Patescibacteria group bacterium]